MSLSSVPSTRLQRALLGWALFIAAETTTQIVFKVAGASLNLEWGLGPMLLHALESPWVWAGFALYFVDFLLWILILKDADLGRVFPLSALVYVASVTAAVTLFHETLNPARILGVLIIMIGVAILSGDENTERALEDALPDATLSTGRDSHA